ncbi:histidine kinase [Allosphingosinicella flava]|uniref:Histidine kinase n=2 Tax=Allosphingosinicella flava TaxID=2771430 RepID=A0A7T2LNI5_9SPHN|nr:histidine kinase [Sphingosinicella flava]
MGRFLAGVGSALLLVLAGFFIWKSRAESEDPIPPAPAARQAGVSPLLQQVPEPPAASEKTKEEKRFARADKDDDGRITRAELLQPRQKPFAKLDKNGNGSLSFEEWAATTVEKFDGADKDRSGWLSPREYETTKPKPPKRKKCAC